MKPATNNDTIDIYREGAAIAFDVSYDQVTSVQRQLFKEHAFLITYARSTSKDNIRALLKVVAEAMRAARQRQERA